MDDPNSNSSIRCPQCLVLGIECVGPKKIPKITLASLVKPEYQKDIPTGRPFFCPQRECDTVYFDTEGHQIKKDQLTVKVWQKEEVVDIPVCYCFEHSAKAIMEDARLNSPPSIPLTIREKIKAGLCTCEVKNPKGTCCLGDVAYWVKQA